MGRILFISMKTITRTTTTIMIIIMIDMRIFSTPFFVLMNGKKHDHDFQYRLIHGKGMERKIIFDLRKNKIIRIKPFKQNIYQKIIQLEERKEEFLTLDTIKQICRNSKYYYNNMNRKNGINVKVSKINKYIY